MRRLAWSQVNKNGNPILDYDLGHPEHVAALLPTGMLGLGLTALLASFMSGMAGNVTAFNTVWTYDIYQSYIRKHAPDDALSLDGEDGDRVWRSLFPSFAAYAATRFNNIMDFLQLVFAF